MRQLGGRAAGDFGKLAAFQRLLSIRNETPGEVGAASPQSRKDAPCMKMLGLFADTFKSIASVEPSSGCD
jgi:hypothetical protein